MACLDEATFMALATGGLPPDRAAGVDAHLDACPGCRLLVAEAFQVARTSSVTASAPTTGPALPPAPDTPPTRGFALGRYLVLERLGSGGMGVVYSAYDPELDRRVALKLLRATVPGLDAEAGRAHLLREAQAMARVSHPHVVPVYDVGTFGGRVYLAMECVEARTLRQWLRAEPRTWRQVRDAFVQAGRGLAAAHAAGLVHGDIKPENLLVGGDGRVRVTDFGLARFTVDGQAPRSAGGTPAYMAPEQLGGGAGGDVRSDQFSFCAALYEGLYGERPFAGDTVEALAKEVCAGRVRPVPRGARVPSWLHRVVLRGLEVDPAARHASMEALLAALLDDPVARRRGWLGMGAGLALLLGAVAATHALHSWRARACDSDAEQALEGIWDEPRQRAVEAAFLGTGRPFAADAWARVRRELNAHAAAWAVARGATCQATRVRGEQSEEVMAQRMRCLDRRRVELAALTQVLAQADADVVGRAMRAVEALPSPAGCADGAALAEPAAPQDAATRQRQELLRTAVARARALGASGQYTNGRAVVERAVEEAGGAAGAEALLALAELRELTGDYPGAEAAVFQALNAAEAGRQDTVAARAWALAVRLSGERLEQYALAHRWRERAEAAIARLGGDATLLAGLLASTGRILSAQGRHADAEARYQQAVALLERTEGPESLAVADVLLAWSNARVVRGHLDEALELAQRALALREHALGKEHPEVGQALVALAEVRLYRREFAEAERLAVEAVERLERALGPEHPEVGIALNALASCRLLRGHPAGELVTMLERALRLVESRVGPDASRTAVLYNNLASALNSAGRLPEAVQRVTEAIARMERALGPEHPMLVMMYWELGDSLRRQGRLAEALPSFERAAALQAAQPEDLHGIWAPSQLSLAQAYLELGRTQEAEATLSRFLAGRRGTRPSHRHEAWGRFLLARTLWRPGGDKARAVGLATEARRLVDGDTDPSAAQLRQDVDPWLARHREKSSPQSEGRK